MKNHFAGRFFAAVCAALLAALALAACAQQSAAEAEDIQLDPFTGQQAQYTGQRAVGIVIENAPDSTEQCGLSSAEVVLEALTSDGAETSLCLVYPSVDAVPQVGPVAAGQDLYWRLLSAQQVLPVQRGGGVYNANYLEYYNLTAVDALEVGLNAFSSPSGWVGSALWYTSGSALSGVLQGLNISASLSESDQTVLKQTDENGAETLSTPALLPFGTQEQLPEPDDENAVNVRLCFDSSNATGFVYNAETGAYAMLHADGTPQLDANNGQQAEFDNLIILYSTPSLRDDGKTLDYDLTVGGGAWLHGGKLYSITWQQGADTTFALYDAEGKPLELTPGRSYLALVASMTGEELSVTP